MFKDPGGWLTAAGRVPAQNPVVGFFDWLLSFVGLTAPDSNDHLIKRVIGLPGDTVVVLQRVRADDGQRRSARGAVREAARRT